MKLNDQKTPRSGFTLIELLVVIAIIAVLMSLTAAAVMKFLQKGPEVKRRSDISQLQSAIAQFKAKFGVDYLPSRFALRSNITQYTQPANTAPDNLDRDSVLFLRKMFSDRVGLDSSGNAIPLAWNGYDANGAPILIPDGQRVVLTGDQCLVFFLGGITYGTPPDCQGFCSSAPTTSTITALRNPTQAGGDRIPPFYKFESKRLVRLVQQSDGSYWYVDPSGTPTFKAALQPPASPNDFYSYADPYGTPYAYFSSYKLTNGYARYGNSDCVNLGVSPYQSSTNPVKYYNPNSFQIISAGPDKVFGPGGLWTAGTSTTAAGTADDMANFADALLGAQ